MNTVLNVLNFGSDVTYPTMDKFKYGDYTIEVVHDEMAENPFESWDGLLPCVADFGHSVKFYQGADEFERRLPKLSRAQIAGNLNEICKLLGYDNKFQLIRDIHYWGCDIVEVINDYILDRYLDVKCPTHWLPRYFDILGIEYVILGGRGYVQGDQYRAIFYINDEFREYTGTEHDLLDIAKSHNELLENWAYGDVYGFRIIKDGDSVESCWGFYGSDHNKSGLLEAAIESIECFIEEDDKEAYERQQWEARGVMTV